MPPDYDDGLDNYLADIRMGMAVGDERAQYRPGRVSGTGSLLFDDPDALKRIVSVLNDFTKKSDGPDLAELEQTYRV